MHARILGRLKRPLPMQLIEVNTLDGIFTVKGDNLKNHELAILIAKKLEAVGRDKIIEQLEKLS